MAWLGVGLDRTLIPNGTTTSVATPRYIFTINFLCYVSRDASVFPKSLYACLYQFPSRTIFYNVASTSPLLLHHSPNPTTRRSSCFHRLWSSLKVSHIITMTRTDSFAALPDLPRAPVVPARFRRLHPGDAIRGISK
jgi:hypothetical protein